MDRIWDILRIEATTDKREIKRAYASRTKEIHPEEKPEEFQILYEAYQRALRYASFGRGEKRRQVFFEAPQREQERREPEGGQEKEPGYKETAGNQNEYEKLGFDFGEAEREKLRLEELEYFQSCWKRQLIVWGNNGRFLNEDWKRYLRSEKFREIMWSPVVLETMVPGIRRYCMQKEMMLLFFWDVYDFENTEINNLEGAGLELYKILYPAYTNRVKRQQYEENRKEIKKEENRPIWKIIMIIGCIWIGGIICVIFLMAYYKVLDTVLAVCTMAVLLVFTFWMAWHVIRG